MTGDFWLIRNMSELSTYYRNVTQACAELLAGGPIAIKVGRYKHPRSVDQNAMLHALCREIADHWNSTHDEKTSAEAVKRDVKVKYGIIVTEYSPVTDSRQARIKSTAEYTSAEMAALITATLAWAADNGIPLADPRV